MADKNKKKYNYTQEELYSIYEALQDYVSKIDSRNNNFLDSFDMYNKLKRNDDSETVLLTKGNTNKAKYVEQVELSKKYLRDVYIASKKYGINPYDLLSATMIERHNPKKVTNVDHFRSHNLIHLISNISNTKYYDTYNIFNINDDGNISIKEGRGFENLLRDLGIYNPDIKQTSNKIIDRLNKRIDKHTADFESKTDLPKNNVEAHAYFIKHNGKGLAGVNPKQQELENVKHDYVTMVTDASNSLRTNYPRIFEEWSNLNQTELDSVKNVSYNEISEYKKLNDDNKSKNGKSFLDIVSNFFGFANGGMIGLPRKASGGYTLENVDQLNDTNLDSDIMMIHNSPTGQILYDVDDVKEVLSGNINDYNYDEIIQHAKQYNKSLDKSDRVSGKNNRVRAYYDYLKSIENRRRNILSNMQDKIENDILIERGQSDNISNEGFGFYAKHGGMIGRKRFNTGGPITDYGSLTYGTKIRPIDLEYKEYSAKGEGIVGANTLKGAGTGIGAGASIGALIGSVVPGIGTLIGSLIGAGAGLVIGGNSGYIIGSHKRKNVEQERAKQLAETRENQRQQTLGNMATRLENDVAQIRNNNMINFSEGQNFYAKLGGFIPRRKLSNGGNIHPNSNNTLVAYGNTHDQVDSKTGLTGVTYGDVEVEGGGCIGNIKLAGEVIQKTPIGDRVFSDRIIIPGTRATYADIAKVISDQKGYLEQTKRSLDNVIESDIKGLENSKENKLKTGTNVRNTEKDMIRRNRTVGKIYHKENQLSKLFDNQEKQATMMGLRGDIQIPYIRVANGGCIGKRPKYFNAGWIGLGTNVASSLLNFGAGMMSANAQKRAIEWEENLPLPQMSRLDYVPNVVNYNITNELSELDASTRQAIQHIENNTSDSKVARNAIAALLIDSQRAKNDLYRTKKDVERAAVNENIAKRTEVRNKNKEIDYINAAQRYAKMTSLNRAKAETTTQKFKVASDLFNDIADIAYDYTSTELGKNLWDEATQKALLGRTRVNKTPNVRTRANSKIKSSKENLRALKESIVIDELKKAGRYRGNISESVMNEYIRRMGL